MSKFLVLLIIPMFFAAVACSKSEENAPSGGPEASASEAASPAAEGSPAASAAASPAP